MKKILSIILLTSIMMTMALPTTALGKDKIEHKNMGDTVQYEDFVGDGAFEFLNTSQRIDSNGNFEFSGNQIVSTKFKVSSSTITISSKATSEKNGQNYKITLYQSIDSQGTGYKDIGSFTYTANNTMQSHSFTNINTSRTLYFVIKTTGIATKPVSGTGKVSNYLIGVA